MDYLSEDLTPPARLAVAYAPLKIRPAFALMLLFDARMASLVANANEPLIGQMKLAWWRDALSADVGNRPKGEPYLSSLFAMDDPTVTAVAIDLVDAWEYLVVEENWSAPTIHKFATARGVAIFDTYAQMVGCTGYPPSLASQWAIDDLRTRFGDKVKIRMPAHPVLPRLRQFRPLNILAMSVSGVSGPRLIWHALTGR